MSFRPRATRVGGGPAGPSTASVGAEARSRVLDVDRASSTRIVNLVVKVALVASFVIAIGLSPDTVDGKAMGFRAPLFLAPVVVVPLLARFRNVHDRRDAVLLGYGFGALAIVWWEILEWVVSEDGIGGAGGLALTYGDTIGDLLLSSTGGLIGSILAVRRLGPVDN